MGSSSSRTRRLTLENEDPTSVIKVSDDVVNRLKGSEEVRKKQIAAQHPTLPPPGVPMDSPPPPFLYEPSITSLQIRQDAAEKLKKSDQYWEKRIKDLERSHDEMKCVMEVEFKRAMDELAPEKKTKTQTTTVPCLSNKNKVMACYKKYPNEPMRCAKEVQAFQDCVNNSRIIMVENAV